MTNLKQICHKAGYTIDHNNCHAIEAVEEYLSVGKQQKGMLFYGFYGTGKTWLMKLIAEHITPIEVVSTDDIVSDVEQCERIKQFFLRTNFRYQEEPNGNLTAIFKPFCFDELGGINDRKLNIWGTQVYPMAQILKTHYEKKILCHAITNYELSDLEKLYGGETVDRFAEMFTTIQFNGGSRRK